MRVPSSTCSHHPPIHIDTPEDPRPVAYVLGLGVGVFGLLFGMASWENHGKIMGKWGKPPEHDEKMMQNDLLLWEMCLSNVESLGN